MKVETCCSIACTDMIWSWDFLQHRRPASFPSNGSTTSLKRQCISMHRVFLNYLTAILSSEMGLKIGSANVAPGNVAITLSKAKSLRLVFP